MMRPPGNAELLLARELAEIAILDAALDVSERTLRHEHPSLECDGHPHDPPSLRAARRLAGHLRRARRELNRYRAVLRPIFDSTRPVFRAEREPTP